MKLSLIFPAYNEEKRILPVLEGYYNFFTQKLKKDFEFIIVPNNCKDKTPEIAKGFAKKKGNVKVIVIKGYSGKGGAVLRGFNEAEGNLIGFTDCDDSTSPEEYYKIFQNLGKNYGIIASRKIKGAKIYPKRKFYQDLSSRLFNLVSRIFFGLKYHDTQCGAKLFKRELIEIFMDEATQVGWMFDVEFLYIAKKHRKKILEYPIKWKDSEGSHLSFFQGIASVLGLIKLRFSSSSKDPKKRSNKADRYRNN